MTPRSLIVLTLVLVATTAGAAVGPAAAQQMPTVPDTYIVDGSAQTALTKARAKWKAAKIRSYHYEARRRCFCPDTSWHVVNVNNGSPSRRVHATVRNIATVPRLFRTIQRAIDGRAHDLTVTYGTHGVPVKIAIDSSEYVIDEEQNLTIRGFKRR